MKINIKAEGLDELKREFENLAYQGEIDKVNKKIFRRCADITKPAMQERMPVSENNAKSGKIGYRPPGHARDNIPVKATQKNAEVGWLLTDDERPYFYMKFIEWGTDNPPREAQDFIYNTREELDPQYSKIAEEEYQAEIKKLEGRNHS